MLRTNSKKVREKIRVYIQEGFDPEYCDSNPGTYPEICRAILAEFQRVKGHEFSRRVSRQELFEDYLQGLPSILNSMYYYNVSAVDLVGGILEETKEEREKFTESQAAHLMTYLIYSELLKGAEKA